jgi:orotidine-5'-phosphate decarboxylase
VVCSGVEAASVREALGPEFVIVCPGVRPAGGSAGDQVRVATPAEAIQNGADYLVVGRPIRNAADPVAAAVAIVREARSARG